MNKYQKIVNTKTRMIQRNSNLSYRECKRLARFRAIYNFYKIIDTKNKLNKRFGIIRN